MYSAFGTKPSILGGSSNTTTAHETLAFAECPQPPRDSVSCLQFAQIPSQGTFLLASSWDGSINLWQVTSNNKTEWKLRQIPNENEPYPILHACWFEDKSKIFLASANGSVQVLDLATQKFMEVTKHSEPVSFCYQASIGPMSCLISASWDKTIRFTDLRQTASPFTINLDQKVLKADIVGDAGCFTTSAKNVHVYKMQGAPTLVKKFDSKPGGIVNSIKIMKDVSNNPIGAIMAYNIGKADVEYFTESSGSKYSFNCHRISQQPTGYENVYSVNCVSIHPLHRTFITAGSDESYYIWDPVSKQSVGRSSKNRTLNSEYIPYTATAIDDQGQLLAAAKGYDWSRGFDGYNDSLKPSVLVAECFNQFKPKS